MENQNYDQGNAKRSFGRLGAALLLLFGLYVLGQYLLDWILRAVPDFGRFIEETPFLEWIYSMIPLYGIAIPPAVLLLDRMPTYRPQISKLRTIHFLEFIPISLFIMYSGNIAGTVLSFLLTGGAATNPVADFLEDNTLLKVISVVILAPLVEEFVFRKKIIDHCLPYGEKWAILLSAVVFGLFHGNFFQFFYAAGLGLLQGYIYVRTGRLWYTILLHGIVNFMGGVIAPYIVKFSENAGVTESVNPGTALLLMLVFLYVCVLLTMFVLGLIRMIIRCKQLTWIPGEQELPKGTGFKTVFLNPTMILFTLLCVAMMVVSLFMT